MDDFFWVLVFIFFVVAPLLERVLKGGSRSRVPPPSQRRPPQRRVPPAQRDAELLGRQRAGARTQSAEDVLPPELWELLTGQKPPTQRPRPLPTEQEWDEEADRDEEKAAAAAERLPVRVERDESRAAEDLLRRREHVAVERQRAERPAPRVVSMESVTVPPDVRHRQFHQKIDRTTPAPAMEMTVPARHVIAALLREGSTVEVRRAILMHEVLGPPKGLE